MMNSNNSNSIKKVLWFSRHEMTPDQLAALGNAEVHQIDRTINSAFELKDDIEGADIIAIVAPIGLQQQFLKLAGDRPVITPVTAREFYTDDNGVEQKTRFKFVKWERLLRIDIVKEDFVP